MYDLTCTICTVWHILCTVIPLLCTVWPMLITVWPILFTELLLCTEQGAGIVN